MSPPGTSSSSSSSSRPPAPDGTAVETLQSLIVAFVLAMTFRGFVTEGFVIPTGSMAPTLMGQHVLVHSDQTGADYRVDAKQWKPPRSAKDLYDPMLGRDHHLSGVGGRTLHKRLGDRILVLKCLYPFSSPQRFDVVVFKNPTDPDGPAENYIKRLIGLPNEAIWLVDGDVFAGPADDPNSFEDYTIQRKPVHVQRAVWQPVHHSDYLPVNPQRVEEASGRSYASPWFGEHWLTEGVRSYRCDTADPTTLDWNVHQIPLDDWTTYNMASYRGQPTYAVSDLRVCAGIVADQRGLQTSLEIQARGHRFEFSLEPRDGDRTYDAVVRVHAVDTPDIVVEKRGTVVLPKPGQVFNVEFWHVDQSLTMYVNGRQVTERLEYAWSPMERLEFAYGQDPDAVLDRLPSVYPQAPSLRWHFQGSPATLHRVRVDRDLYYRPDKLERARQKNGRPMSGPAFGTHPDNLAVLGPDHFFMCGDNSPASSDSRVWGMPHPLVAKQIDPSPFVAHRKLLLGKAWVVYFPAMHSLTDSGWNVVPDFGRVRFIR